MIRKYVSAYKFLNDIGESNAMVFLPAAVLVTPTLERKMDVEQVYEHKGTV